MPYIKKSRRMYLDDTIDSLAAKIHDTGELNYVITKLIHAWIAEYAINYAHLNATIGVLECAKLELYRQVVGKYEDKKKSENGPVSELDT